MDISCPLQLRLILLTISRKTHEATVPIEVDVVLIKQFLL